MREKGRVNIKVDFTTNDYRFMSCDDDAMLLGTDNRFYSKREKLHTQREEENAFNYHQPRDS